MNFLGVGIRNDMTSVTDEVSRMMDDAKPIVEPGGEPPPDHPQDEAAATH